MSRTSYAEWPCTIARTVDVIGDAWSLLILREAFFFNARRFAEFEEWLMIPTNVLSGRLKRLVEAGILAKQEIRAGRTTHQYVPTAKGAELWPVIAALSSWGNRWMTDTSLDEIPLQHRTCGARLYGERCSRCDARAVLDEVRFEPGPLLVVFADLFAAFAAEDLGTDVGTTRLELLARKLERSGCLDEQELMRLLEDRSLGAEVRAQIGAFFSQVAR